MSSERKISHWALTLGTYLCLLGAIWYPQDAVKWVSSSIYLALVGKNFGLTFQNQKIVGSTIRRAKNQITNFLPMRKR